MNSKILSKRAEGQLFNSNHYQVLFYVLLLVSMARCQLPQSPQYAITDAPTPSVSHQKLKEDFFSFYSKMEPEDLSSLGAHTFDGLWKDWSPTSIEKETAFYSSFLVEAENRIPNASLQEKVDLEMMKMVATFKYDFYNEGRQYWNIWVSKVPIATLQNQALRIQIADSTCVHTGNLWLSVIKRIEKIPEFLADQERNLKVGLNRGLVPNRYTYLQVLEDITGALDSRFFEDLSAKAKSNLTAKEMLRFKKACLVAVKAYINHKDWLTTNIGPKALINQNFRLGRTEYEKRLRGTFFVDATADSLEQLGRTEMIRINKKMQEIATGILREPIDTPEKLRAAMDKIRTQNSSGKTGVEFYEKTQEIVLKDINKIGLFRSYDDFKLAIMSMPAGVGGRPPAANWPALLQDQCSSGIFLIDLDYPTPEKMAPAVTAHEGIPGHYYQSFVWQKLYGQDKAPVRFLLVQDEENFVVNSWATAINVEGWAFYIERLLESNGFYKDPVEQLEALALQALRAVRVVNDIGLHAYNMSIEEAARNLYIFGFEDNMRVAKGQVEGRYAVIPMQGICYLIGARQIETLREDWASQHPDKSTEDFHSYFLHQGPVPPGLLQRYLNK